MSTNRVRFSNLDDQIRYQPISWTPAKIATALWLDADDASTITEDVGVSVWADKGSVGTRDVSQATGTKQPAYNSTTKSIVFDGVDDSMKSIFTFNLPFSIICIMKLYLGNLGNEVFIDGNVLDSIDLRTGLVDGNMQAYSGGYITQTYPFTNQEITMSSLRVRASGDGASDIFKNGNLHSSASVTGTSPGGISLGSTSTNIRPARVDINEVIAFDGFISTETQQKAEGYAAWKWDGINGDTALVTALDASHPYKLMRPLA